MKRRLIAALALTLATAASAFANSGANMPMSALDKILQGHGQPGETATSSANPDISYRVTENGTIEKVNARFDTVEVVKPRWWLGMSPRERESRSN